MKKIIDCHCHVFNGSILKDMVAYAKLSAPPQYYKGKGSWWTWIKELSTILFCSEHTNQKLLVKNLQKHFPKANEYITVPLMMDIQFMFNDPLQSGQKIADGKLYLDNSLQKQVTALQNISKNGNCYPFFAVDPRRTGLIKYIINEKVITKSPGGFYGIKLYPRLGYHPMSGDLPELYNYCAKNNIPITTHCSNTGFPPWKITCGEFTNPENFKPALEANPNLRINFAHWGHGNESWGYKILELMKKYPHVYADLSCYTEETDLMYFKASLWKEQIVQQRTLYGSDFDVFYLTETSFDIEEYINTFKSKFTNEELKNMMSNVPINFLGV